jgi:hypothetical protein
VVALRQRIGNFSVVAQYEGRHEGITPIGISSPFFSHKP